MTDSNATHAWQQIAALKPRLRAHVSVEERTYRGQQWYVLNNQSTAQHFRFPAAAYRVISELKGELALSEVLAKLQQHAPEQAPSEAELVGLMNQLQGNDLVSFDVAPNYAGLEARRSNRKQMLTKQRLMAPLSMRFSLCDPDAFLARTLPLVSGLFTRAAGWVWLLVVMAATVVAAMHGQALAGEVMTAVAAPHNIIIMAVCFTLLKVLHELGHAYATRVHGGEVHNMGIGLLVLVPVPFVDASAATSLPWKHQRLLVGAAGMLVELFIAALAVFLWVLVEPGVVREVACLVIFIASLSTLLFNANPLLKFDGYYMLVDWLELPNLSSRAGRWYGYLVRKYAFGVADAESPATSAGEQRWYAVYGAASFIYRLFVAATIILFIAGKFFIFGVILAAWVSITMLLLPIVKYAQYLANSPLLARRRPRAMLVSGGVLAALVLSVFYAPVPSWTRVEGVIWLPEQAHVRAAVNGDLTAVMAQPGQLVDKNTLLFRSEDPLLQARVEILRAERAEVKARHYAAQEENWIEASNLSDQLADVTAELEHAEKQLRQLDVVSPRRGRFMAPGYRHLPGSFVRQGDTLGYVAASGAMPVVRLVVTQDSVGKVRGELGEVEVRFSGNRVAPAAATVAREVPAAASTLPSKVLGSAGGGQILVSAADKSGLISDQQLFQFEIQLLEDRPGSFFGERVQVRFDHGSETLAVQIFRTGRQLFLSSFGV
jgi:putative peptide zinc metalloprotease protein